MDVIKNKELGQWTFQKMADIACTLFAAKIISRNAFYMAFCDMKSSALTTDCNDCRGIVKGM